MQIRRVPAVCLALVIAATAWPVQAQRNNNNQPKPTPEQADFEQLYRALDAVVAGTQPAPADIPVTMSHHHMLMTQSGAVMVPFTVNVDKSKVTGPAFVYLRVVDKSAPMGTPAAAPAPAPEAKGNNDRNRNNRNQPAAAPVQAGPTFPVSSTFSAEVSADGQVSRAIELKPGSYEMFFTLKEKSTSLPDPKAPPAPLKAGLLRYELTVPDMSAALGTSSVILANSIEPVTVPLTPEQQAASPYTIGGVLKISPNATGKFPKAGEMAAVFWVYGVTSVQGKPDVTVEYSFHRKEGAGDKYFNRTEPQAYNAQTSAPNFNLDAGHQVLAIQGLSVASFPAGDYRLEIKVTDKPSGKTHTQSANFTVLPV